MHLPKMLTKRRAIQATRKVDDAYLLSLLLPPDLPQSHSGTENS